jgi:hypothetical protein
MVDQVLQKSLLCFDPYDLKPHIVVKKYTAPIHLGEYLIAYLFMEIVVCNYVFFEDHRSIFHPLPPLVVERKCVLQVFLLLSKLIFPTSTFDMKFLKFPHIFFHFQDCLLFLI